MNIPMGSLRFPGHDIATVFGTLSCWADGGRAGRFAAAELKVDVMAKEVTASDVVIPYYKAAHWTRGWADRGKAARFVATVKAFGREDDAVKREYQNWGANRNRH